ncbi:hypothetical protein B566_EDAN010736, partial [Ephemera danica]
MNKKNVVSFILFAAVLRITTGFEYQCDGSPENNRVLNLKKCEFLSEPETQLECIMYGKFFKSVQNQVVSTVLKFRMVFLVQRKAKFIGKDDLAMIDTPSSWWCIKTSRIELELVPNDLYLSSDIIEFPPNLFEELFSIEELRMQISYPEETGISYFNKSSAFLNLRNMCDPEIRPLSDGCTNVKTIYVRYKMEIQ